MSAQIYIATIRADRADIAISRLLTQGYVLKHRRLDGKRIEMVRVPELTQVVQLRSMRQQLEHIR